MYLTCLEHVPSVKRKWLYCCCGSFIPEHFPSFCQDHHFMRARALCFPNQASHLFTLQVLMDIHWTLKTVSGLTEVVNNVLVTM